MTITRKELLQVALSGYAQQVGAMQDRMREITRELMGTAAPSRGTHRKMQTAGTFGADLIEGLNQVVEHRRGSIKLEQLPKRRRALKNAGKRRMSPEGRARIGEATRKRWAEYRKAKEASGV